MNALYLSRIVALLGDIARSGRSGRLQLDAARKDEGGSLSFSSGSLTVYGPPGGGQGADEERLLAPGLFAGALGESDSFGTIADGGVGGSCEEPGEFVHDFGLVGPKEIGRASCRERV